MLLMLLSAAGSGRATPSHSASPALVTLALVLACSSISPVSPASSCRVYSGLGQPCVFPFRYNGEFFTECTNKFDSSKSMCPIKLGDPLTLEASSDPKDWGVCSKECNLKHYRTNQQIYDQIVSLSKNHSSISRPFIIGSSARGQPLIGLRISEAVRSPRRLRKPMVRLVANINGNEAAGREILMQLGEHLLTGYGKDARITRLVDSTDISLLPALNPDGWDLASEGECSGTGRGSGAANDNGVDINTDFPGPEEWEQFTADLSYSPYTGRQPETLALMDWSTQPFVISANLHDGAVLVTYPYDHFKNGTRGRENLTPDNDIFTHLSFIYSSRHGTMTRGTKCYRKSKDDLGMENGASWFSRNSKEEVTGSLKDFSYLFTNNLDITVQLSCCKYPKSFFLVEEWENNKESLLSYLEQVHMGVKGLVSREGNTLQPGAEIIVWNPDGSRRAKSVLTSQDGEYWRLLLPNVAGNNTFTVQARWEDCDPGGSSRVYESLKHKIIISENSPLKVQDMRMRNVGFCGIDEITNTLGVIEDLERLSVSAEDRVPRDKNNGDLQQSFSSAVDEVFA